MAVGVDEAGRHIFSLRIDHCLICSRRKLLRNRLYFSVLHADIPLYESALLKKKDLADF